MRASATFPALTPHPLLSKPSPPCSPPSSKGQWLAPSNLCSNPLERSRVSLPDQPRSPVTCLCTSRPTAEPHHPLQNLLLVHRRQPDPRLGCRCPCFFPHEPAPFFSQCPAPRAIRLRSILISTSTNEPPSILCELLGTQPCEAFASTLARGTQPTSQTYHAAQSDDP